jgi:hypothetical protein
MKRATSALALLTLTACGPKVPTEAEAREAFRAREAALKKLEESLEAELAAARIEKSSLSAPCQTPGAQVEKPECARENEELGSRRSAAAERFQKELFPRLAAEAGALGGEIGIRERTAPPNQRLFGATLNPGCPPGYGTGTVTASQSKAGEGDFKLGWGLYQTAWQSSAGDKHGDGAFHPGLEVLWSFPAGELVADVALCILTDGTPRPR